MPKTYPKSLIRKEPLTEAQRAVLFFVSTFAAEHGYPPTRKEIADHFDWTSHNAAEQHLRAIERKNHIKITPGVARGIAVLA